MHIAKNEKAIAFGSAAIDGKFKLNGVVIDSRSSDKRTIAALYAMGGEVEALTPVVIGEGKDHTGYSGVSQPTTIPAGAKLYLRCGAGTDTFPSHWFQRV